jgi:RND superfamily putative drug exporter
LITSLAGRRAKWLVLAVWLLIVLLVGPLGSKISSIQKNDSISYLPNSAESTKVNREYQKFPQSKELPATIAYRRATGLGQPDLSRITADRGKLAARLPNGGRIAPPVVSPDRTTAMLTVPLSVPGTALTYAQGEDVAETVRRIQRVVGHGDGDLRVAVTGQAGYSTASADITRSVSRTLFLVSLLVIALILVLTYRSPFLWAVALAVGGIGMGTAEAMVYVLGKAAGVTLTDLTQGLLTVLALGASTNYALLLIARYREELYRHADKHDAMRAALRRAGPTVFAAAATVVASLLCLLAADLNSTRGLGPICVVAIVCAMAVSLTLLPAVLTVFGRWLFWPLTPRPGAERAGRPGVWARIGTSIRHRPRVVWIGTVLVLAAMATGLTASNTGLGSEEVFTKKPQAVIGQDLLAAGFPAGTTAPVMVIGDAGAADQVFDAVRRTPGITQPAVVGQADGRTMITAVAAATPAGKAAQRIVRTLRDRVHAVPGGHALVGGNTAIEVDTGTSAARDRLVVIPLVLVAIMLTLGLVLRAIVAPVMLIATVILSYCAALGVGTAAFGPVFGFAGQDDSLALHAFVYLVAFGVDYNIFLMTRVREESARLGTEEGVLRGLAGTGHVITSAGLVLAAAFAAICVLPLVPVVEVGVVVAFGVLLDTLVVRSVLVPALTLDIGERVWWPGRVARPERPAPADAENLSLAGERDE